MAKTKLRPVCGRTIRIKRFDTFQAPRAPWGPLRPQGLSARGAPADNLLVCVNSLTFSASCELLCCDPGSTPTPRLVSEEAERRRLDRRLRWAAGAAQGYLIPAPAALSLAEAYRAGPHGSRAGPRRRVQNTRSQARVRAPPSE